MIKEEFDSKLEAASAGSSKNIKYCFLSCIYTRQDRPNIFELALVNSDYDDVYLYRTCDLRDILTFGYVYDFSIEGQYFKCNPFVKTATGDSILDSTLDQILHHDRKETIFSFLARGTHDGYVIISDDLANQAGEWVGVGITSFYNIKFSKSTMSIYVPLVEPDGITNKMLVTETSGKLAVNPFYYGIPADSKKDCGEFVRRKTINGVDYDIYYIDFMPVYDELGRILSNPVINTAVQMQTCYSFVQQALEDILDAAYSVKEDKPAWAGGSKSYTSSYSVEFTSNLPKLTKKDRVAIINSIMAGREPVYCEDPRVKFLTNAINALELNEDGTPNLNSLHSTIVYLKKHGIMYGSYLMVVKYHMFCSHERITGGSSGVLCGGVSDASTLVKEGF